MSGESAAPAGLSGFRSRRLRQHKRGAPPAATGELAAPQGDGRAAQGHSAGSKEGQTTGKVMIDGYVMN